jgi:hypothetical protein
MHTTASKGFDNCIKALCQSSPPEALNALDKVYGATTSYFSLRIHSFINMSCINRLQDYKSPMHLAAEGGYDKCLLVLGNLGADCNIKDEVRN